MAVTVVASPRAQPSVYRAHVMACAGTGCTASGSHAVFESLQTEVGRWGLGGEVQVIPTGCRGFCVLGPIVIVYPEGIFYCQVTAEDVPTIVEETLIKGRIVPKLLYREPAAYQGLPYYRDIPFYSKQTRIALRNCGMIDPDNIEEYVARGGYEALGQALSSMAPEEVIDVVKRAGLRGRGGAGFLTGLKWELTRNSRADIRYVICNADEGDPGAFMDRSICEGDPHSVIEGMLVGGYAIGAREGYIYCRAEYPLAVQRLRSAIEQAKEYGLLGENILNKSFSFDIQIREGAGAFVCGEETALIASLEGRRGEPRPRPPFPAGSGLWGKPTCINNVETWATVPAIISKGAEWFASIGTERSKGTKVFALTGRVNNVGLVEVPMGITLGDIVFDIGGGIANGKRFKAVQTGGPLGGCLPASQLNTPVDYDSLTAAGATMGSGGMIVVDEDTCMVELARFFLTFASAESCGQCSPCRIGGQQLKEVLTRITEGRGEPADLARIASLAETMSDASLCALGKLTPNPILSTLRYFKDEYEAHILDRHCPAGTCKGMVRARCTNACPAEVDVPTFVALVEQGRYAEALEVHRERNPFAAICGRVCPAFCEQKCRRGEVDEAVSIRLIKRLMSDQELANPWTPPRREADKAENVSVVGAGPAGLTAALRLAQFGYKVTVHEALPVAGGMMRVGIPDYRLPPEILEAEIDNIRRAGVEIKLESALGSDVSLDDLQRRGDAVVLSIGAHHSRRLGVPGDDLPGVLPGTTFLRDVALGKRPDLTGKRVAVVGGGDVAIDAARTAWRCGASVVHLLYRRTREEMPALPDEVKAAEAEGIQLQFLVTPTRVLGNGHGDGNGDASEKVTALECQPQRLGDFDAGGRRRPMPIADATFELPVDVVIPAIGQAPETDGAAFFGLQVNRDGTLWTDPSYRTSRPGVFAAGDAAAGPATVAEAVAQGNAVALAVHRHLQGRLNGRVARYEVVKSFGQPRTVPLVFDREAYAEAPRVTAPELELAERRSFREVEIGLEPAIARAEARRCLRCDLD